MIGGRVRNREAIIELEVAGPDQEGRAIEAVIDAGFNGYLTLPGDLVAALGLPFAGHRRATLADGRVVLLDVSLATVGWHGQRQDVLVSQTVGAPLAGMSLLQGSRLTIDVFEGGYVVVDELPAA